MDIAIFIIGAPIGAEGKDPDMSNTRDGLWNRICESYEIIKPQGAKYHNPDELQKKWDRIKTSVSRFCDI